MPFEFLAAHCQYVTLRNQFVSFKSNRTFATVRDGDTYHHALQKYLNSFLDDRGMLGRLNDKSDPMHPVRFASPAEHNVAQLLLRAQLIVARFAQYLRHQIDDNIRAIVLRTTLQIHRHARAFVKFVFRFEQVPFARHQFILSLEHQLTRQ